MVNENRVQKSSYLPGIDLAKLLVMFFMVSGHVMLYGLKATPDVEHPVIRQLVYNFLFCIFASLNVYALATGYLLVNSRCKYSRLVALWAQMVFTGLVMTVVLKATGLATVSFKDFTTVFRPISCNSWWYMSAYFIVAILAPFLNVGVRQLPRRKLEAMFLLSFTLICASEFFTKKGFFVIQHGFCTEWLLLLYAFGAYLRVYQPFRNVRPRYCFAGILFIALSTSAVDTLTPHLGVPVLTKVFGNFRYYDLASPGILLIGILLFVGCCNLRIESPRVVRTLKFLSPTVLGIYLIHYQPFFWKSCFLPFVEQVNVTRVWLYPLAIFGIAAVVFVACVLLEILRVKLFDLLHVNERIERFGDRCASLLFFKN